MRAEARTTLLIAIAPRHRRGRPLDGRLPHGIALRDFTELPLAWSEQRRQLGLAA